VLHIILYTHLLLKYKKSLNAPNSNMLTHSIMGLLWLTSAWNINKSNLAKTDKIDKSYNFLKVSFYDKIPSATVDLFILIKNTILLRFNFHFVPPSTLKN
jgi:hypothetical protein